MIQIIIAYLMDGPKDFPNTKFLKRVPNYLCIFQNSIFPHFSPFFPYYGIIFRFSLQN